MRSSWRLLAAAEGIAAERLVCLGRPAAPFEKVEVRTQRKQRLAHAGGQSTVRTGWFGSNRVGTLSVERTGNPAGDFVALTRGPSRRAPGFPNKSPLTGRPRRWPSSDARVSSSTLGRHLAGISPLWHDALVRGGVRVVRVLETPAPPTARHARHTVMAFRQRHACATHSAYP